MLGNTGRTSIFHNNPIFHVSSIHTYTCTYLSRAAISSIWQSLGAVNQRMNRNQTGQTGGCVILVHSRTTSGPDVRAGVPPLGCVCVYVRGCVHSNGASVRRCSLVIWSNLEAINRREGIAFAWICGLPIVRRWKNVNKAAALALFLSHHLNVSSYRASVDAHVTFTCSMLTATIDFNGSRYFRVFATIRVGRFEGERREISSAK